LESKICQTCKQEKSLTEFYKFTNKYGKTYYRRDCKQCVGLKSQAWRAKNTERSKEIDQKYFEKLEKEGYWQDKNIRHKESGYYLDWQRSNPDKLKQYNNLHDDHEISEKEWIANKNYFNNECAYCGLKLENHWVRYAGKWMLGDFHKDHMVHDGSNGLENCIPACKSCNTSKHTALLIEWYNIHNKNYSQKRYNKIIKWCTEDYKKYLKLRSVKNV